MNQINDKENERRNQTQNILELLKDIDIFPSTDGETYAEFLIDGHKEIWPVQSSSTSQIIQNRFFKTYKDLPEKKNLDKALSHLIFKGRSLPSHKVYRRVGRSEDRIYIDLGDPNFKYVEVDRDGWRIVPAAPLKFTRASNTLSLPTPLSGGDIRDFRQFLNIEREADFVLVVSFMIGSLCEGREYPILILQGPQGSAKSTMSSMIKELIDPGRPVLRSLPKQKEEDLFIMGQNCHLLCFDNLSGLSAAISDSLCKISTGCGFSARKLFTNGEEFFIELSRPMIINGIDDLTARPDLSDRSLVLHLPKLSEQKRIQSSKLHQEFQALKPFILGCLLDGLSHGLNTRDQMVL